MATDDDTVACAHVDARRVQSLHCRTCTTPLCVDCAAAMDGAFQCPHCGVPDKLQFVVQDALRRVVQRDTVSSHNTVPRDSLALHEVVALWYLAGSAKSGAHMCGALHNIVRDSLARIRCRDAMMHPEVSRDDDEATRGIVVCGLTRDDFVASDIVNHGLTRDDFVRLTHALRYDRASSQPEVAARRESVAVDDNNNPVHNGTASLYARVVEHLEREYRGMSTPREQGAWIAHYSILRNTPRQRSLTMAEHEALACNVQTLMLLAWLYKSTP